MVLIRLRPELFPLGSFTELHVRRVGPFRVAKKLGTNAYVIELPPDFGVSPVFNIEDLTEFEGDAVELSTAPAQEALQPHTLRVPKNTAPRDEIASILDHQFVTTSFWCSGKNVPVQTQFGCRPGTPMLTSIFICCLSSSKLAGVKFFSGVGN